MSQAAKITLITSIIISSGIVWGVHYQQKKEKEFMHSGIIRDEERRAKKDKFQQNQLDLEQQLILQREYEKIQPVKKH
ncbi:16913_t:CDS:2 [Funneliformis geosporum]|nr:16913_t:CDS:2 [Funneliformis geosporum]